jgi:hypothetical protein
MPLPLRADFDAFQLRSAARKSKDAAQARRLLALTRKHCGGGGVVGRGTGGRGRWG